MPELPATLFSFPTIVFTILMAGVFLYWLTVILGAIDLDFLDGLLGLDTVDTALDGALDSLDATADGAGAESADAAEGAKAGALAGVLNVMGVRGVPVTIVGSFVLLWAWVFSFAGTKLLGPLAGGALAGGVLVIVSGAGALVAGAFSARPLRRLFLTQQGPRRASLVGKLCTVTSSRVDARTGRAEIDDGATGFMAEVRCPQDNALKRGSRALVYRYEPSEEVFLIGPVDEALTRAAELTED